MSREHALEIVRRLRSDEYFRQQCLEKLDNKIEETLLILKQHDIQADEKDWLEALNAYWIIDKLEEATGLASPISSITRQTQPSLQGEEFDMGLELQKGLVCVVKQIDKGYERVMTMYTIAFYLGIFMVLVSVFASLALRSDASVLILGGLGMADIIASLVFQPAQSLQNSRSDLAQLQAAFFNWINDVHNWDAYLRLLHEEANSNKHPPAFDNLREVSNMLVHNTERMMKLVENYCEIPLKKKLEKNKKDKNQPAEDQKQAALEDATK
ncbi:MAG: hypothetical protein WA130_20295 [Candidatus Methanoperedens sp.]